MNGGGIRKKIERHESRAGGARSRSPRERCPKRASSVRTKSDEAMCIRGSLPRIMMGQYSAPAFPAAHPRSRQARGKLTAEKCLGSLLDKPEHVRPPDRRNDPRCGTAEH